MLTANIKLLAILYLIIKTFITLNIKIFFISKCNIII